MRRSWLTVSIVLMVWGAFTVLRRARIAHVPGGSRWPGFSLILVGGLML